MSGTADDAERTADLRTAEFFSVKCSEIERFVSLSCEVILNRLYFSDLFISPGNICHHY